MPGILDLSELFSTITRAQVLSTVLEIAEDVGLKITSWQPGQPARSQLAIVCQRIADFSATTSEAFKGGLLDYATGGWLTLLAQSTYRVTREPARYAAGDSLQITNAGASTLGPFAPGDLVVAHSVTGKTYYNQASVSLPPGVTPDVAILAHEAGSDSNAGPDAITSLVTSIVDVSVTNVSAVLGSDEENDDELRQRCRDKLAARSPLGPKDVYAYVVKSSELCATSVPITRVSIVTDDDLGDVSVYVATAIGAPVPADVAIAQETIEEWAEPWCIEATAIAAGEVYISCTMTVTLRGSAATAAQVQDAIRTRLATYLRSLRIGGEIQGRVDLDALKAEVFQATPGVKDVLFLGPTSDVTIADHEVAVLGSVDVTSVFLQ